MSTIAIGVFENDNPVPQFRFPAHAVFRVGVTFRHPESAPVVHGHGDGLLDVWFCGKHGGGEAFRPLPLLCRLLSRQGQGG